MTRERWDRLRARAAEIAEDAREVLRREAERPESAAWPPELWAAVRRALELKEDGHGHERN
jgi:hypothetical protein